jgi:hypothetical protein
MQGVAPQKQDSRPILHSLYDKSKTKVSIFCSICSDATEN